MDNYPLLDVFLTMVWFFLFVAWISCLLTIFRDIFRSRDLSGAGKAGWTLLVAILPLLGVLLYLAVRGASMQDRDVEEQARREQALQEYIRRAAAQPSTPAAPVPSTPAASMH